jgi:hypothetical protein
VSLQKWDREFESGSLQRRVHEREKRPEQFAALLFGEVEIGQNIALAVVEKRGELT